jgi:hypothetical protein
MFKRVREMLAKRGRGARRDTHTPVSDPLAEKLSSFTWTSTNGDDGTEENPVDKDSGQEPMAELTARIHLSHPKRLTS